jgi:hypothetical protein
MTKYLLSTGETTTKIEEYVLDLFKMNLIIRPNDIPHYSILGFDFTLVGVPKDSLKSEVKRRIESLINNIQNLFDKSVVKISLESIEIINEETISIVVKINNYTSNEIKIDI